MTNPLMSRATMALVAACLGFAVASAGAQEAGSRQSREFVQAAANSDQFEILEAHAALAGSTNPEVRAFASRMLQDHQRLSQALRDAAARSGLKPPEMAMSADQAKSLDALQSASGSDFDKLYLKQQVLAHHSALTVEQIYAKSGDDAELRRLAASAVPLISAHGDMANQLETKLGAQ
jgi:putative membrane protein